MWEKKPKEKNQTLCMQINVATASENVTTEF